MNWQELDIKIQAAIISAFTSVTVIVIGWVFKFFYDRYSLTHKLKKEYLFEQKKKIKEEISKTKIPLLNAAEEFNYRMWNFNKNISECYHQIEENKWFKTEQYYLNSFVYRFLTFMHYCIKTDEETLSIDSTVADNDDILFLKYVKTFRNIFCDIRILEELGYTIKDESNHFFRNNLKGLSSWVQTDGNLKEFDDFKIKLKYNYSDLRKVIEYFSNIENDDKDKSLNVLRCAHLIIIQFLNSFGHSYQQTSKSKFNLLLSSYCDQIHIKKGFKNFINESKLDSEMKHIIKKLKIT